MGHFIPTNATATAEATARLFFDRIISIHGILATLISDSGPKLTSKFRKELMGLLGTKLTMSSAYHPQTGGQKERLNQEPLTPQQPTTPAHIQAAHDFVTTMQQVWEKTLRRLTMMQNSHKYNIPLALTYYMEASQCFPCSATEALQGPQPTVLWRFGFQFSTIHPTPLAIDHWLTGPFPDEPFESSGPYAELVGCPIHCPVHWTAAVRVAKYLATTSGMGLVLGGTQPVDDVETQHLTQCYCFSLGAGAVLWRSTQLSSLASSSAEAEIYAGAMVAQELRWLTFLLTDLGERPCLAPTLYADNKAMILLCREP
ncbi:unnamed protein product [Closterium sp. NIES-54]